MVMCHINYVVYDKEEQLTTYSMFSGVQVLDIQLLGPSCRTTTRNPLLACKQQKIEHMDTKVLPKTAGDHLIRRNPVNRWCLRSHSMATICALIKREYLSLLIIASLLLRSHSHFKYGWILSSIWGDFL